MKQEKEQQGATPCWDSQYTQY